MLAAVLLLTLAANEPLTVDQQQKVDSINGSLNSPFCPGRTLATCSSGKAKEWRDEVRGWVQEGLTEQQIEARLQERVPDFRLEAAPPGAWSWAAPAAIVAALTAAFALVGLRMRPRRSPPQGTSSTPVPSGSDADRSELAQRLDALD